MNFTPLTREQFTTMSDTTRTARRAHWAGIIRGLQADHDRRYHAQAHILALELTCTARHCQAKALSGSGLCAQHLHKARSAA